VHELSIVFQSCSLIRMQITILLELNTKHNMVLKKADFYSIYLSSVTTYLYMTFDLIIWQGQKCKCFLAVFYDRGRIVLECALHWHLSEYVYITIRSFNGNLLRGNFLVMLVLSS